jgi:hypothetical protein
MSDGELEHLMSQLGGQIETIDAPAFLGAFDAYKPSKNPDHPTNATYETHDEVVYPLHFRPSNGIVPVPGHTDHHTPATYHDPELVHTGTPSLHTGKHPSNTYKYENWKTHWPNQDLREIILPENWNPDTTTARLKPRKHPSGFVPGEKKSFHTHFVDGRKRTTPLEPHTNENTHYDSGRLRRPPDWAFHTHFNNNRPRPPDKHLKPGTLYDPNYKKPTNTHTGPHSQQAPHKNHGLHNNTEELNSIMSELKKLTGQNKHLQKLLDDAKSKHERHNARHAEQLDMIRSSAPTPTGIHYSAPTGATGGAGGGRKTKTGFGGVYKPKSQKYTGGGRNGRGGGSGN